VRCFIGVQLHLVEKSLLAIKGRVWFYDFLIILFEMLLFIFLGGVTSLEANKDTAVDFFEFLMAIYLLDILWVITQSLFGIIFTGWRRSFIPWYWAVLNSVALILIFLIYNLSPDPFATFPLLIFGAINVLAFISDVILVEYFDLVSN